MDVIADILLIAGALGAGFYCFVLSRRLKRFNDLEKGVGGAVAVMSAQVDDMTKLLASAQEISGKSSEALDDLTVRAEAVAQRLELMMASLHDLPELNHRQGDGTTENRQTEPEPSPSGLIFTRHPRAVCGQS
jgi:hypothetical protein